MIEHPFDQTLYDSIELTGKKITDPVEGDAMRAIHEMLKRIDSREPDLLKYNFVDFFFDDSTEYGHHIYVDDQVEIIGRNFGGRCRWRSYPVTFVSDYIDEIQVVEEFRDRYVCVLLGWRGEYCQVGEVIFPVDELKNIKVIDVSNELHTVWERGEK